MLESQQSKSWDSLLVLVQFSHAVLYMYVAFPFCSFICTRSNFLTGVFVSAVAGLVTG